MGMMESPHIKEAHSPKFSVHLIFKLYIKTSPLVLVNNIKFSLHIEEDNFSLIRCKSVLVDLQVLYFSQQYIQDPQVVGI